MANTIDPGKAKPLLAGAGHPNGFKTEPYAMNTDPIHIPVHYE